METLYFDYNIINYLRGNTHTDLTNKYEEIESSYKITFSPAHLEEIAVSAIRDKVDENIINEELSFLKKIATNNSLRPSTRNKVVLYDEYPEDCYSRVIENYAGNEWAEKVDASVILDAHKNPAGSPKEVNNIKPEEILNPFVYRELIAVSLHNQGIIEHAEMANSLSWDFSDLKERFYVFEAYVNLAANLLEKIGYHREKEKKSRSRLHDVSHIIYGAYADTFVSADKKLLNKTKAIYHLLGVPTKVLSMEEFCSL